MRERCEVVCKLWLLINRITCISLIINKEYLTWPDTALIFQDNAGLHSLAFSLPKGLTASSVGIENWH